MEPNANFWAVFFTSAPANLSFILDKNPVFDSRDKAFALLDHYCDEFDCTGYVADRYGMVKQ